VPPEPYVPGSGWTGCVAGMVVGAASWFVAGGFGDGWVAIAGLVACLVLGGAAGGRYGDRFFYWYFRGWWQ